MRIVTVISPGLTVSVQLTHTPVAPASVAPAGAARAGTAPAAALTRRPTVVLWPASRCPEAGATASSPIKPGDSVMDQSTGPPEAVSVSAPPLSGLSTIVSGATMRVPAGGGGALLEDGAGELGDGLWLGDGRWLGDGECDGPGPGDEAVGEGPPPGAALPADGDGDTRAAALAVGPGPPGLVLSAGAPDTVPPGPVPPDAAPPDGAPPGPELPALAADPGADEPWLSALSWLWCAPSTPVTARMISTAAAATAAAAAAPGARRVRHQAGFGWSNGTGKPSAPDITARCASAARCAVASGVLLLASLSTRVRSPGGMATAGTAAAPSSSAGVSSLRLRSVHAGHRSMCRLMRLRISTFSSPSQSSSSAASAAQSARPERATSSAPSETSSWLRARESSAWAWLRETPSTAAISATSSSCRS